MKAPTNMTITMQRLLRAGLLGLIALISLPAQADLATNLSIDIRALSLGNAVTADPPGVSAIHYNPAGLTHLEGRHLDFQIFSAAMNISADYSAPAGYGVFGYSDDPVVCSDRPHDGQDACANFRTAHSKVTGISLYVPVIDDIVDLTARVIEGSGRDIIANHLIAVPDPNVTIAHEAEALPVEVIVRGYITGVTGTSLWRSYELGDRRTRMDRLAEGGASWRDFARAAERIADLAAMRAGMMRQPVFIALGADGQLRQGDVVMRAPHIFLGRRGTPFR